MSFPPYYGADFPGLPKTGHFPLEMADLGRFPNLSGGKSAGFPYPPSTVRAGGAFLGLPKIRKTGHFPLAMADLGALSQFTPRAGKQN